MDFAAKEQAEKQAKVDEDIVRIEQYAVEKITESKEQLEKFDIRIMEAEEILKDKADETEKIYKTITELGIKLGKEKSETLALITS